MPLRMTRKAARWGRTAGTRDDEARHDGRNERGRSRRPTRRTHAGPGIRQRGADAAPLFERARCLRPDADLIRMTPMLAAARCSCSSLVAATKIKKVERTQAARPARCSGTSLTPREGTKSRNLPEER